VENIFEAFNDHRIAEKEACNLLGIKWAQFYKLRRRWLNAFRRLPKKVGRWLYEELAFIQQKAKVYRGRFNFAILPCAIDIIVHGRRRNARSMSV